jgi:hypothetical protein
MKKFMCYSNLATTTTTTIIWTPREFMNFCRIKFISIFNLIYFIIIKLSTVFPRNQLQ